MENKNKCPACEMLGKPCGQEYCLNRSIIEPCKQCGSSNIDLWDCGYTAFNPGGGRCNDCGWKVEKESGINPTKYKLTQIWNKGQLPTDQDKLIQLCKELLAGADKCGQAPHYIVQPFMGIVLRHIDTINDYNLMEDCDGTVQDS